MRFGFKPMSQRSREWNGSLYVLQPIPESSVPACGSKVGFQDPIT
jgi:hypothetical protein